MSDFVSPDADAAQNFLRQRINYERTAAVPYQSAEFKLDRMRRLMRLLGDPHLAVPAVHVAGTKGKGSTAAMIASVLRAAGLRTGLYTSPHLEHIEERILVDDLPSTADSFRALAARVQPAVEQLDREAASGGTSGPTFFEVTTAMAFLRFAEARVAVAVLEVGLGGRLDSTNICRPEVCLITSISLDHTRQLGSTLAAIAGEKAGIIKTGVPVICGVVGNEPRQVIASRAGLLNAPLFQRGVDYDFSQPVPRSQLPRTARSETLDYYEPASSPQALLAGIEVALLGRHQAANAAAAVAAIYRLRDRGWSIGDQAIRRGLFAARCPARIEQVASLPTIILDVAHNLASIEALLAALREHFSPRRRILIFASSKDKDFPGMLRLLLPQFDTVILTQYIENPRATETEVLLTMAQEIRTAGADVTRNDHSQIYPILHATTRPHDALRLARTLAAPSDLICITGSFFLAAELRRMIPSERAP